MLFLIFYSAWLVLLSFIGLTSSALLFWLKPHKSVDVTKFDTICKVLNDKKILSDEDYFFETKTVANSFSAETFLGYRLIVSPWIYFLKRNESLDRLTYYLVCKWIDFQKKRLDAKKAIGFFPLLALLATSVASGVGKALMLLTGGHRD